MKTNSAVPQPARRGRRWSRSDLALLRYHAIQQTPTRQIAVMLGRTQRAVYCKAEELGITLLKDGDHDTRRKYSDDMAREAVRRFFAGEGLTQISAELGIPKSLISNWTTGRWRPHLRREVLGR